MHENPQIIYDPERYDHIIDSLTTVEMFFLAIEIAAVVSHRGLQIVAIPFLCLITASLVKQQYREKQAENFALLVNNDDVISAKRMRWIEMCMSNKKLREKLTSQQHKFFRIDDNTSIDDIDDAFFNEIRK